MLCLRHFDNSCKQLSCKVWVLCVNFSPTGLQHLLFDLSRRGSVRWDLNACFENSQVCCGQGLEQVWFPASTSCELCHEA